MQARSQTPKRSTNPSDYRGPTAQKDPIGTVSRVTVTGGGGCEKRTRRPPEKKLKTKKDTENLTTKMKLKLLAHRDRVKPGAEKKKKKIAYRKE
ncbi:hypothetical protein SAY87_011430 [Trapa incisa]|uniref:Uncharacterized protein n=1 Tax=Trapa incisa TaxID=236973 RepID=A0AAN7JJ71_9MYRT|nr:hypothetical protein SAY87_011430 [Trapa incisa]